MRHGRQHGTRQMIELLQLGSGEGWGGCERRWNRLCRWVATMLRRSGT